VQFRQPAGHSKDQRDGGLDAQGKQRDKTGWGGKDIADLRLRL
jgi:hypothetical protein